MTLRPLGRSALQVSPLCFGGNVFGWTADERTSFSLLDAWIDAGFNFVDTADVYSRWAPGHSGGESETVIGRWIRQGGRGGLRRKDHTGIHGQRSRKQQESEQTGAGDQLHRNCRAKGCRECRAVLGGRPAISGSPGPAPAAGLPRSSAGHRTPCGCAPG